MASSSASHQQSVEHYAFSGIGPRNKKRKVSQPSKVFDVFINHRGPDVKEILALPLYNSLQDVGLTAFLDSQEIELGDFFPSTIQDSIRSTSIQIAIFSPNYAESAWCLAELVLMLQTDAMIIPVFYNVEPSQLRYIENGVYAKSFLRYQEKKRYLDKLEKWKEALHYVSFINGYESSKHNHDLDKLCKNVVSAVVLEIQKRKVPLEVATNPVGLNELVAEFESHLMLRRGEKVQLVGIFGMGGSGKTTLAKELFNRKRSQYNRSCFLFNVREASCKNELPTLQTKLLKDLLMEDGHKFQSTEEGSSYLRYRMESTAFLRFLIVIDDIDHTYQLDALLGTSMLNPHSLVIVTTRDERVLINGGVALRYKMKQMNAEHSLQLFCSHAFRGGHPKSGYGDLIQSFVNECGGLPLSLQVLGGHVFAGSKGYWQLELDKVSKMLNRDVKQKLQISFDTLDFEQKQIFMDIACFFIGKPTDMAIRIWEGSGWSAEHALQTLQDKCLVVLQQHDDGFFVLGMHDQLCDLGREMASELNHPRRLWSSHHHKSLEAKGFQNIIKESNIRCLHTMLNDSRLSPYYSRITFFLGNTYDGDQTSTALLWLELDLQDKVLITSMPSWIPLQNLQGLRIRWEPALGHCYGYLNRLWKSGLQAPSQLKELLLHQTVTNHLGVLNNFEKLDLKTAMPIKGRSLLEFLSEATSLRSLVVRNTLLSGDAALKLLGILNPLEKLDLGVDGMPVAGRSLSMSLRKITNLKSLVLRDSTVHGEMASDIGGESAIYRSPGNLNMWNFKLKGELSFNDSIESRTLKSPMSNLTKIEICNQNLVSKVSINGQHCPSLQTLKLCHMKKLTEVGLTMVTTLNCLELNDCKNLKKVSRISDLVKLVFLNINQCPELQELSCLANLNCLGNMKIDYCEKLNCFQLYGCRILKTVTGMCDFAQLVILIIRDCPELEQLPILEDLNCLEMITIDECRKLNCLALYRCQNLKRVAGNFDLEGLYICDCPELLELPSLGCLTRLEGISIVECGKLQSITLPTTLNRLKLEVCGELKRVSRLSGLTKLVTLKFFECPKLEELPTLGRLSCLERITIVKCNNLKRLFRISDLPKLVELNISDCCELEFELCLVGLNCLKGITIDRCGKLNGLELKGCKNLKTVSGMEYLEGITIIAIHDCPELEVLPLLQGLSSLEKIAIDRCGKLNGLELKGCKKLKTVSEMEYLEGITILAIHDCPELEVLPLLQGLSSLKRIAIDRCGKLNGLELKGCKKLKTVSGMEYLEGITIIAIHDCPELEVLPLLQGLSSLERIAIDRCGKLNGLELKGCKKLKTVSGMEYLEGIAIVVIHDCPELEVLPRLDGCGNLKFLELEDCKKLKRLSVMSDLAKLTVLNIRKCRDLEELSNLAHLSCLERITIVKCKKLRRVLGMSGLAKLVVVNINQCPELVGLSHTGLNCLTSIKFDRCGKLKSFELNGCEMLKTKSGMRHLHGFSILNIHDCPQLEKLPLLQGPSCLESITINGCSQLNCLELNYFANLKTISGMLDLAKLVRLDIRVCPELEELPILAHLSCLESITIIRCEKLRNITLPATLSFLKVKGCTQLKRVPGISDLKNLVTLFFLQCPELVLKELSTLSRLSSLERITIDSCKKLQNITGIEELQVLRYLQLSLANNVALRSCIYRLQ
ncbi:hypothetical protein KI387_033128, partial [Taxus chinensis]